MPHRMLRQRGIVLVLCVIFLCLLTVIALGLAGIASIELRRSVRGSAADIARANARLALMQAIGQLQRTMGPDQRVSANAEILGDAAKQPFWTGAWRTSRDDGTPFLSRDAGGSGWHDSRPDEKWKASARVIEWLVSGRPDPTQPAPADAVPLFGPATAPRVSAPRLAIRSRDDALTGHFAWWTGDLGVRANIATRDPRAEIAADPASPADGGMFRVMASQAADLKMMAGGVDLSTADSLRLATSQTLPLTAMEAEPSRDRAFDFTVDSIGLLTDTGRGGLKQDLGAYFETGPVAAENGRPGLADDTPLTLDAAPARLARSAPRFGLLRDWARLAVPFSSGHADSRDPEFDSGAAAASKARALANEQPVRLAGNQRAGLQPVLVEATNFTQMSTYLDRRSPLAIYQLRQLMYPRVVLWNPYNCELRTRRSIIMIQGNGRQEMWTRNQDVNRLGPGGFQAKSQWINFEGGRSTSFSSWPNLFASEGYNDPYMGSYYFSIPATTFGPGECLVFSPARTAEYDGLSVYRPGSYDLANNELSCEVAPDPSRCYYVSASDIDGGMNFLPYEFWYALTWAVSTDGGPGVAFQSDDTRAILKQITGSGAVDFARFDALPQLAVLSASLQYGAGREPRIVWSENQAMPMQLLDKAHPAPTQIPNVRTREGIRLRWFDENRSNLLSGFLNGTAYLEEAPLANWNPRAAYVLRSPWENIGGQAPWFFGSHTRDLYDEVVGWEEQTPVPRKGRQHGNPFGPPQESPGDVVLFDVPRTETGVVSLGQLQHAKLSDLVWHPSYAIGNSLADPRLGTGGNKGLHRTIPAPARTEASSVGGFDASEIGWSSQTQRSSTKDEWAANARAILGDLPKTSDLVYDLSFEANLALWDRFFLSTGSAAEKQKFAANPAAHPLPNGRLRHAPGSPALTPDALASFHRAASVLALDGAFNVNSTRVEAWKALLSSTRRAGFGSGEGIPFPRILAPPGGAWADGKAADNASAWSGYRELDAGEIDRLARAIVTEVRLRGPFLSLADFVNRRLAEDETGRMGALQAAIDKAGLNRSLADSHPLDNTRSLPDYKHPDNIPDATRLEQTLKPATKAWGAPAFLTQADLLQVIGPALTARSDTFVIRAYGDATDSSGSVLARAWCEAVVQRTPRPVHPAPGGLEPVNPNQPGDFGRRFQIARFRWLSPDEI